MPLLWASRRLAHPAQQLGPQKSSFPGADAPFRWAGHSFPWPPSSHLPTQVKGGRGGGLGKGFCAVPAPSLLWVHSPWVPLALSPISIKRLLVPLPVAEGLEGQYAPCPCPDGWWWGLPGADSRPTDEGRTKTQQSRKRVGGLPTPIPKPPVPWGVPGTGMPQRS